MEGELRADHHPSNPEAIENGSSTSLNKLPEINLQILPLRTLRWVERRQKENPLPDHIVHSSTNILLAFNVWDIAVHEEAHAHVISELGGQVQKKSVIPEGNSEGRTIFRPPDMPMTKASDLIALYIFYIAAAAASEYGEEMVHNKDHRGCCGDRGMIEAYAQAGEKISKGVWTKGQLEAEGRSRSRRALSCLPVSTLEKRADYLVEVKEVS